MNPSFKNVNIFLAPKLYIFLREIAKSEVIEQNFLIFWKIILKISNFQFFAAAVSDEENYRLYQKSKKLS